MHASEMVAARATTSGDSSHSYDGRHKFGGIVPNFQENVSMNSVANNPTKKSYPLKSFVRDDLFSNSYLESIVAPKGISSGLGHHGLNLIKQKQRGPNSLEWIMGLQSLVILLLRSGWEKEMWWTSMLTSGTKG